MVTHGRKLQGKNLPFSVRYEAIAASGTDQDKGAFFDLHAWTVVQNVGGEMGISYRSRCG